MVYRVTCSFRVFPDGNYIHSFFFFAHTNNYNTLHYIYNSLQVTVIIYKNEIKRKGKTKSTKIL